MEIEGVDTKSVESADTEASSKSQDTTSTLNDSQSDAAQQAGQEKTPSYFANGKERLRVNGQEVELTFEEMKRFASLGRAGHSAMERAVDIEKKANATYQQILELAKSDPKGLIRMFNPDYAGEQSRGQSQDDQDEDASGDPRDTVIKELKADVERLKGSYEQRGVAEEKAAIASELKTAIGAYPEFKDDPEYFTDKVKMEYRKLLNSGVFNVSIDDVAFTLAQNQKDKKTKQAQEAVKRHAQTKQNATVSGLPSGGSGQSKGMSRDDVRKLAGLPPA